MTGKSVRKSAYWLFPILVLLSRPATAASIPLLAVDLRAIDSVLQDGFGSAVAVSGDIAVVGGPFKDTSGVVYLFRRSNGALDETLTSGQSGWHFGSSVAIDGQTVIIGSPDAPAFSGTVRTFLKTLGKNATELQLLRAPEPVEHFGYSVALSGQGSTAVVGALHAAFVFTLGPVGWELVTKLPLPADADSQANARVAIDGNNILVGLAGQTTFGRVYSFVRGKTSWVFEADLTGTASSECLGLSVAVHGDTAAAGASCGGTPGSVHMWSRSQGAWVPEAIIPSSATESPSGSVALGTGAILIGDLNLGASLYRRGAGGWTLEARVSEDRTVVAVALSDDSVLIGAHGVVGLTRTSAEIGSAQIFYRSTISLQSEPTGRSLKIGGAQCPVTDTVVTPATLTGFTGASCLVTAISDSGPVARYTFDRWDDQLLSASRILTFANLPGSYTAEFKADYKLSTVASPVSGGATTGDGFYPASTNATVSVQPAPGFLFAGFQGDLKGTSTPQQLLMDGPKTVSGIFIPTPPATLNALITGKSGPSNLRQWTILITNAGPGTAYALNLGAVALTQTFGTACIPVRIAPSTLPMNLGNVAPAGSVTSPVIFDMSGCPGNARFTALIVMMANNGAVAGVATSFNQFQ
jgi:hypothetical protein